MSHYLITNSSGRQFHRRSRPGLDGVNKRQRQHTLKVPFFIGRYSLMFLLIGFIGVLSVVYLILFNSNATNGYQIQRLEFERNELLTEREQKNLSLSRTQTLEYLQQDDKINRMVQQQPEYFVIGANIAGL